MPSTRSKTRLRTPSPSSKDSESLSLTITPSPKTPSTISTPSSDRSYLLKVEIKSPLRPTREPNRPTSDRASSFEKHLSFEASSSSPFITRVPIAKDLALGSLCYTHPAARQQQSSNSAARKTSLLIDRLPPELLLIVVHQLKLSELINLSVVSLYVCDLVSAPSSNLLNTKAVMYWYWGSEGRPHFSELIERDSKKFQPTREDFKKLVDHLWMRDQINDQLYDHFMNG